jgi:hypothetical protein
MINYITGYIIQNTWLEARLIDGEIKLVGMFSDITDDSATIGCTGIVFCYR